MFKNFCFEIKITSLGFYLNKLDFPWLVKTAIKKKVLLLLKIVFQFCKLVTKNSKLNFKLFKYFVLF